VATTTRRTLQAVTTQTVSGQQFIATFERPPVGTRWYVERISVEIPNYKSGKVSAVLNKDGRFVAGTSDGERDTADAGQGGSIVDVWPGSLLQVVWNPTNVPGIVQGRAELTVRQTSTG